MQSKENVLDYLFFDIECCDGKHMCSFGYIIVDANFRNAKKYDILINPLHPFKLGKESNPFVKLAHTKKEFASSPTFDHFYARLKKLFAKKDRMFLGFSTNSDLGFLKVACEQYDLPKFDIESVDIQIIFQKLTKASHVVSLQNACQQLQINTSKFALHKSCDDAHLTMLIAKKLCKMQNCSLADLAKKFPSATFLSKNLEKKQKKSQFLHQNDKIFKKDKMQDEHSKASKNSHHKSPRKGVANKLGKIRHSKPIKKNTNAKS